MSWVVANGFLLLSLIRYVLVKPGASPGQYQMVDCESSSPPQEPLNAAMASPTPLSVVRPPDCGDEAARIPAREDGAPVHREQVGHRRRRRRPHHHERIAAGKAGQARVGRDEEATLHTPISRPTDDDDDDDDAVDR